MRQRRRHFVGALAAGVTGVLAGCGGSDSETPSDGATETEAGDTTSPEAMGTETDDTMGASDPAQVVTVGVDESLRFAPASFEVPVGSTVRWDWEVGNHNVKADTTPSGSDWSGTPGTELYGGGHTYSYSFDVAGEYSYYCDPHRGAGMTGSFTVTQ